VDKKKKTSHQRLEEGGGLTGQESQEKSKIRFADQGRRLRKKRVAGQKSGKNGPKGVEGRGR